MPFFNGKGRQNEPGVIGDKLYEINVQLLKGDWDGDWKRNKLISDQDIQDVRLLLQNP